MTELNCPHCQATLTYAGDADAFPTNCPFCDGDLSELMSGISALSIDRDRHAPYDRQARSDHQLPANSEISILAPEPGQLVLQIPPGKSKSGIFFLVFGAIWNGIVLLISLVFLFNPQQIQGQQPWFLIPFLGLFFLVGFGVLYAGIAMKYTRAMLLLEPDRAVMQKSLFGRNSFREISLTKDSRASLLESYRENNVPVYCIAVSSGGDSLKFGTSLTTDEKNRLVDIINSHLGYEKVDFPSDTKPGLQQERIVPRDMSPEELSADSMIRIIENREEELVYSYPLIPSHIFKWFLLVAIFAALIFTIFAGAISLLFIQPQGGKGNANLFLIIPIVMTFTIPLLMLFSLYRARVTIGINSSRIVHQISAGPFRRKRSWSPAVVTGVSIRSTSVRAPAHRQHPDSADVSIRLWAMCTLDIGHQWQWLALGPQAPFCREVAGLARYQLHRLGNSLDDDSDAE